MRKLKSLLQRLLNIIGFQALRRQDGSYDIRRRVTFGRSHIRDVKKILDERIDVVFDVGANEGQTVRAFLGAFPTATIYSFEPDPDAFARLHTAVKRGRVHIVCAALGRNTGIAQLHRFKLDQTNSLLPKATDAEKYVYDKEYLDAAGSISVQVTTIANFCDSRNIRRIDLLKIDTQGYELEVLMGARDLLKSGSISLVYVEVCFVPYYEGQPLFQGVYQFLYENGYRLVGLYESGFLTHRYQVGGNALFVHESLGPLPPTKHSIEVGLVRFRW